MRLKFDTYMYIKMTDKTVKGNTLKCQRHSTFVVELRIGLNINCSCQVRNEVQYWSLLN